MLSLNGRPSDAESEAIIARFPPLWRLKGAPAGSPFLFEAAPVVREAPAFDADPSGRGRLWNPGRSRSRALSAILAFADEDEIDAMLCVSRTKLYDRSLRESDPGRYIDTVEVPYVTLPLGRLGPATGAALGDLVAAIHPADNALCFAVVGDSRDAVVVEPSLYLADALGISGREVMRYLVFPGSGEGQGTIPSVEQIQARGDRLYRRGGERSWTHALESRRPAVDRTLNPAGTRRQLSRV